MRLWSQIGYLATMLQCFAVCYCAEAFRVVMTIAVYCSVLHLIQSDTLLIDH